MNNKELKEFWSSKTLGELRGIYSEKLRISNAHKESIREKSVELASLDFENKYYVDKAKNLMNDISFYKSYIKDDDRDLKILKPILDKKEIEGINQEEYERYITDNTDIRVLIKAVEDNKQEFIKQGGKVTINVKNKEIEIVLTEKEINRMYDAMLKETIMIIKNNIGNIKKVEYIRTNPNRGMDGFFIGENGDVSISTIIAGGYNIQQAHYRTLVYKRNY